MELQPQAYTIGEYSFCFYASADIKLYWLVNLSELTYLILPRHWVVLVGQKNYKH